ncbi:hypothetical protein F5882DRAFT_155099 [Hyaloscypha sp. PMI_1271]|nr:hypothetical protein F5882DRAFT_155099 [Hyaloscypha sp. PMI_1271]
MIVYCISPVNKTTDITAFKPNPIGVAATDTLELPNKFFAGRIRVNTFFPTCWDGVNLDMPDHKSHVAYPAGADCPSKHPVQLPLISIETIRDTGKFNKSPWPTDSSQPFMFSQGDS